MPFVYFESKISGIMEPFDVLWDFGDGETSDERDPVHYYQEEGYFTVRLTAKETTAEKEIEVICNSGGSSDGGYYYE